MIARIGYVIYWYCLAGAAVLFGFALVAQGKNILYGADYYHAPQPNISDFSTLESYQDKLIIWAKNEGVEEYKHSSALGNTSDIQSMNAFAVGIFLFGLTLRYILAGDFPGKNKNDAT